MSATWRDLNGNGVMDPYENPDLSPEERTNDLLARLSLEEKVGLLFQQVIQQGPGGTLAETPPMMPVSTSELVAGRFINHFNVHRLGHPREAARWMNELQRLAERTPHGIPVTVSTDPRHGFQENPGAGFTAGHFSQWPEPIGLAALDEMTMREFADIARQEYTALGLRSALHPQVDLATEPRWARQMHTFGECPAHATKMLGAYLDGMQGPALQADSVACVTKHFPGGGPQKDGEDCHFPYGREQVYPGGMFETHLEPFKEAIARGTAAMMPYYGMPVGLTRNGEPVEEVGFGYNKQIVTGLLRNELGYDGVVLTDWALITENRKMGKYLGPRVWGVEHLTEPERMIKVIEAGADQFGGEDCTDLMLALVRSGQITEARIDESARRVLLVKFQLGLFDNPFVDEDRAAAVVGSDHFRAAGRDAQSRSVTVLTNEEDLLPLTGPAAERKVYVEGMTPEVAARLGTVVPRPEDADVALVRLAAPYEPRADLFLESNFHQGSLEFGPGLTTRLESIARTTPLIVDVFLDRPAILAPILPLAAVVTGSYGCSDDAWIDAITGITPPEGRLPFDLPSSMDAVRNSREDVPFDTADPLFRFGHGLRIRSTP